MSDEFHEMVKAHKRREETMEETLRRLVGGPDPEVIAGLLSGEAAEDARAAIQRKRDASRERREELRERFE